MYIASQLFYMEVRNNKYYDQNSKYIIISVDKYFEFNNKKTSS